MAATAERGNDYVVAVGCAGKSDTHDLKCCPAPFEAMKAGRKTAEFRQDDRDYQVGDTLLLREWSPVRGYSGEILSFEITHVLRGECGVPEGYAMLSLRSQVTEPTVGGSA